MDHQAYNLLLQSLGISVEQIESSLALAAELDAYIQNNGGVHSADIAWNYSRLLIEQGRNTPDKYRALIRYCRFMHNDEMTVAFLELVDGGEVGDNLYQMVEKRYGTILRDEVFSGIGRVPYGTPSPEKPAFLQPVIERLETCLGQQACGEFLSTCLRDLPEVDFMPERQKFQSAGSIDVYLQQRKQDFLIELETCMRENRLFYAQPITHDVIELVRRDPEMGAGRREGNIIYENKIPYMAKQYLAESDPTLKRYYACHCPWARDAIKNQDVSLAKTFCSCSAGFHKKPLEVIFGRTLKADVLESAIKGELRCRFAIHLPADVTAVANSL
jgi:hypothetical protein